MHADRAVAAVVDEDNEEVSAVLRGGRQLLTVHQEIAVACNADHRPIPEAQHGRNRGGQSIAHGARCGRELGRHRPVVPVAVPPAGEIAGAVGDDRVFGKPLAHRGDARAEVELARLFAAAAPTIRAIPCALPRRRRSGRGRGRSTRRASRRTRPCRRRSEGRRDRRGRVRWGRGGRGQASGPDGRA